MLEYRGNSTVEAIEFVSLRVELIKNLCDAMEEAAERNRINKTDTERLDMLSYLVSVLSDEINLLSMDVDRAWNNKVKEKENNL